MPMRWKTLGRKTSGGVFQYENLDTGAKQWGHLYRDALGKRRRKMGFETKQDAIEDQKKELVKAPGAVEHRTFADAEKTYRAERIAAGKMDSSYYHLKDWAKVFGTKRVEKITPEQIEAQLTAWVEERELSPATRNRMLAQLSGMLSYCYRRGWIATHPTDHGRVPMLPENNGRTRWLRAHEVEQLCAAAPAWLADIIRFGAATGMRLGEICGLRRSDYQEDDSGTAHVVVARTKNRTRLYYPLEGWAKDYVKAKVDALPFPGSYLFPGPGRKAKEGKRHPGNNPRMGIRRHFSKAVEACGFEYGRTKTGVTFHTLRHSMASIALNAGVPEGVVQQLGNWKTRTMVARYAHHAAETMRDAAGKVAALVAPGAAKPPAEKTEKEQRKARSA